MSTTLSPPVQGRSGCRLLAGPIDHLPELLENSYALRYEVYCRERKFLPAENYPLGLEMDEFDRHSIHVGAVDAHGKLAGTARVVRVSEIGLPLFRHCTTYPHETEFHCANTRLVEVGRLAVSRSYRPQQHDGVGAAERRRRGRDDVFLTLLKGLYQETKRIGATHWLAVTEPSLQRLLAHHGFPFTRIGPDTDYSGPVAPYQMDLKAFDNVILSRRFPLLDDFLVGLEPELTPQPADDGQEIVFARSGGRTVGVPRLSIDEASHVC
jgi:N-acyl amino acid synthase of PEP-CTERM/exosortase system